MIYYDIQHYGDGHYIPWLISSLDDERNMFRVNCDLSESHFLDVKSEIEKSTTNIAGELLVISHSQPVTWCGPSLVEVIFDSLRYALKHKEWHWFINLSGTCAPIKPQSEIRQYLESHLKAGISAHFNWFRPLKTPFTFDYHERVEPIFKKIGRLKLLGDPELLSLFFEERFNPVTNPQNRVYLKCCEYLAQDKMLHISWLDRTDRQLRESFFQKNPHYCGRSWFMLHRSAVEEIISFWDSSRSSDLQAIFLNCFAPDESVVPTIVMNSFAIGGEKVSKAKFRSYHGAPRLLRDANYEALLQSEQDSLFIRKIVHSDAELLRMLIGQLTKTGLKYCP